MAGAVARQCNSYPNRTYDEQHRIARCHPQEQIAVHAPRPVAPYDVMRTGAGLSVVNIPYQVWLHSQLTVIFAICICMGTHARTHSPLALLAPAAWEQAPRLLVSCA